MKDVYLQKAKHMARRKNSLLALVRRGGSHLLKNPFALGSLTDKMRGFFRLLKAWASREYRDISWKSISVIIATVLYFVSPLDAIPDMTPAIGFLDDIGMMAWALNTVGEDVDRFLKWERRKGWRA